MYGELILGVLPIHPRKHLFRPQELVRREGPGLAAEEDLVIGVEAPPLQESLRRSVARAHLLHRVSRDVFFALHDTLILPQNHLLQGIGKSNPTLNPVTRNSLPPPPRPPELLCPQPDWHLLLEQLSAFVLLRLWLAMSTLSLEAGLLTGGLSQAAWLHHHVSD